MGALQLEKYFQGRKSGLELTCDQQTAQKNAPDIFKTSGGVCKNKQY